MVVDPPLLQLQDSISGDGLDLTIPLVVIPIFVLVVLL